MEDYLIAYRTTGRPPAPVPQEPTNDQQRTLLSLPPLFKPYSARDTGPVSFGPTPLFSFSNSLASGITAPSVPPTITKPEDLPVGQDFRTTTSDGEVFQSISVMPTFRAFSAEVSHGAVVARCPSSLRTHFSSSLVSLFVSHSYSTVSGWNVITGTSLLCLPQGSKTASIVRPNGFICPRASQLKYTAFRDDPQFVHA